ncbi:nitrogenase [Anaerosporomusa subterranea]|uniref:Nitrogenase n=1 Tax=Anaerosporomusa subterranea TaxID=1794912 RepID=A0A154BVU8_ANASB|nr:nitrogenase [Anaerosporomusa subterranea]
MTGVVRTVDEQLLYSKNVNENPCHMCMPMGGILPFKGIEGAMVIIHGSQGCSTYMRRHIAEHFNEPVDVGSSSLNEKGTIYGGEANLKQGLDNILRVYNPKLIGVLTSCLAETIGEDVERITLDYRKEKGLEDFPVVAVSTPGYGGTQNEGYLLAVKRIIMELARPTEPHNKLNIIIPNISPADIREIKRILALLDIEYTLCPDISYSLDRPLVRPFTKISTGGTKLADIAKMPGAVATIELGVTASTEESPGHYLSEQFGVPCYQVPIPIGVQNTDRFLQALTAITKRDIPDSLLMERGRLLDCMVDSHKYNFNGRSVIFGEPELVYSLAVTCVENGIFPVVAATGGSDRLTQLLAPIFEQYKQEIAILSKADFATIRAKSVELGANIAIGSSDGRYLTEREGISLVRIGFPIHDRVGGQRLLSVGYTGSAMFLDRVTNTLLGNKYGSYRRSMYEKYYQTGNTPQSIGGAV